MDHNKHDEQSKQDGLIDSLLQTLYRADEKEAQSKVSAAMKRLEESLDHEADTPAQFELAKSLVGSDTKHFSSRKTRRRWLDPTKLFAIATVAVILISVSLPFGNEAYSAISIVQKSLEQASHEVARHYRLDFEWQTRRGRTIKRERELYVKGNDHVAVMRVLGNGNQLWYGHNPETAWVVAERGPILEGERNRLNHWLDEREDLSTPLIHVPTILKRMEKGYDLEFKPDEPLTIADDQVQCIHIVGSLKGQPERNAPDEIALWVEKESNTAMRITCSWDVGFRQKGPSLVEIYFVGKPSLPDNWFSAGGHTDQPRRRIRFDSQNERAKQ